MDLTIAIPTYNKAKTIRRTLNSVVKQVTDDVEIIISDNASTDDTEAIVREYQKRYGNIRYYKNEINMGADGNFLNCYNSASGDYVYLLSSDDVLVEGAIEKIVDFIENNPGVDLIFLNHYFFMGDDYSLESNTKNLFLTVSEKDYVTTDKLKFITDAKYQLTYMCSFLVSKRAFRRVENPEKYIGTSFIHACVAFESTKDKESILGVLHSPVVAQDLTPGSTSIINRYFEIFGSKEYYLLCVLAPQFGYDLCLMDKIFYSRAIKSWPQTIIEMRINRIKGWKENYRAYGKEIVSQSKRLQLVVFPALYCPVMLLYVFKKVYKTIKK